MTIELTYVLVMYIVCGDRVECRVRTYAGDAALEEASIAFSQSDLTKAAQERGASTWDESDILSVTGCVHWIGDTEGAAVASDIMTPEIVKAHAFADISAPKGPLGSLIESKKLKKEVSPIPPGAETTP